MEFFSNIPLFRRPSGRKQAIDLIKEARDAGARKHKACEILEVSARTLNRWQQSKTEDKRKGSKRAIANKLSEVEKARILEIVNSVAYCDLPPCRIVPMLADENIYIASESSFYRLLLEKKQLAHRQLTKHKKNKKPTPREAHGPNQVWSWDITYIPSQVRGLYFYLYIVMDIYSRKIVGRNVHENQSSDHGANLIKHSCIDENIDRDQLTLHSDNGGPMKGTTMIEMLKILGIIPSFSRPSVSDDNPYSEALFKTVKYHPTYPMVKKFEDIIAVRLWMIKFTNWYNDEHMHSALKFVTPQQRHHGEDKEILEKREGVYNRAKLMHPERWSGQMRNWELSEVVALNPNRKAMKPVKLNNTVDQAQPLQLKKPIDYSSL